MRIQLAYAADQLVDRQQRHIIQIIGFWLIVPLVLGLDSQVFADHWPVGQLICGILAPLYFAWVVMALPPDQRVAAILFVPFSALGEGLFSIVFGLYHYRLGGVPFYVPFGHAILFSTGLLITAHPLVAAYHRLVLPGLLLLHAGLLLGTLVLFGDTLSAIFCIPLLLILWRSRRRTLYLVIGVLVLYIELIGTAFGCWAWVPGPFGLLHTTNPPLGAFVCYVIADICVLRLGKYIRLSHKG